MKVAPMNTSRGWIKLYRCLLDDPLWQCSTNEQKVILVTLLLMANHAEKKWQWNGRPYHCQPGQMITSLNSIQEKIGKRISLFQIRHAIKRFEDMGFLVNKSSKTGRLITICNWERYQSKDQTHHNDVAQNASTSSPHRHKIVTPNKNVKNEKNDNKHRRDNLYLSSEQKAVQHNLEADDEGLARWLAEED